MTARASPCPGLCCCPPRPLARRLGELLLSLQLLPGHGKKSAPVDASHWVMNSKRAQGSAPRAAPAPHCRISDHTQISIRATETEERARWCWSHSGGQRCSAQNSSAVKAEMTQVTFARHLCVSLGFSPAPSLFTAPSKPSEEQGYSAQISYLTKTSHFKHFSFPAVEPRTRSPGSHTGRAVPRVLVPG